MAFPAAAAVIAALVLTACLAVPSASAAQQTTAAATLSLSGPADDASTDAPPPPATAALPAGLPDNDTFRRRLFFIGDLGEDYVREPARNLLPPHESAAAAGSSTALGRTPSSGAVNQAVAEDARAPFSSAAHDKDPLLLRPASRFARPAQRQRAAAAVSRDAEIRHAMESAEVFQGPLAVRARPRQTYRWAVAPGPEAARHR